MTPQEELMAAVQRCVEEAKAHFWACPGTTLVCCVLELPSGHTVLGKFAFAPSELPNLTDEHREEAMKQAFDDAVQELTKLEHYRLANSGPRIELASASQVQLVKNGRNG